MRLKLILPAFALLLVVSTATSFVGYRYLGLASEYRERNFHHLDETYQLIELLAGAPIALTPMLVDEARNHVSVAQAQAQWCLAVLNEFEMALFRVLGAGGALEICSRDIALTEDAQRVLAEMLQAHDRSSDDPRLFTLGLRIRNQSLAMLEDSQAFHPFVSEIETKLERIVRTGTGLTGLGLAVVFLIISRETVKAARVQRKQTQDLEELAAIAERANDAISLADTSGAITWVNPAFERLTGYSLKEAKGRIPGQLLQGHDTDPLVVQDLSKAVAERRSIKRDILNYTRSKKPYWISLSISPLVSGTGENHGFVAISSDISKEIAQREQLDEAGREIAFQAMHDPLTGLRNRRALDLALQDRAEAEGPATIVRIDLDHFKYVNDTLGHEAGDFVLQKVAQIMLDLVRDDDVPARVGGDEFVVLMASQGTAHQGRILAEGILARIKEPMAYEEKSIRVGASFGVASTLDGLVDIDTVVVGADAALYEAKDAGRNRVCLYTPALHQDIAGRRDMARELKRAIAEEEFVPFFQPQIDAQDRRLLGVETLARWRSDTFGLVMPDTFLPVARRLSAVEEIDDIVFRKAVQEIRGVHEMGLGIDKLSVNVTAHRIHDPNVVQMIRDIDTGDLTIAFEVLESVLVEEQTELFRFGVDALREVGVSIEVDDFGSGHASIIGLMQLGPDAMKIDRRLVRDLGVSPVNLEVVRSIVNIAKSLDLTVIAEGVETEEQADMLAEIGCHVLQGYYIARPMPVEDLSVFVANYNERVPGVSARKIS